MKKLIAGITLCLILVGAFFYNADWADSAHISKERQITIAVYSDDGLSINTF